MIANKEKGADKDKSVCGYNESARLRYFHGMLLDDKDFTAEQEYHVNKRRFLNRMLHGSGVVCGLELRGEKEGRWIEVTSGLALDCAGNEIWVPHATRVDLASLLPPKEKGKGKECEEEEEKPAPNNYYIGIRYEEKPSNPVSVYLPSGSCEERTCENSRYKEGYCIEVAPCCREKYDDGLLRKFCECPEQTFAPQDLDDQTLCGNCEGLEGMRLCQCLELENFCERSVPCPECGSCEKPCHVVLGRIEVDADGRLVSLCNNECRRYVLTGRMLQHMLLGVLVGSEEYFHMKVGTKEIQLPNVAELAHNPIKLLCWFLRYGVIEEGEFTVNLCQKEPPPSPERPSDVTVQLSAMQAQVQTLADNNSKLAAELNKVREEARLNRQRVDELAKRPATAKPVATDEKDEADEKDKEAAEKKSTKSPKTTPK
ncbi:MAG TPA: hypothetical protein VD861_20535 [Pyrinomonadaceae bacterium]|nr:hypothetical protein [Pyrinomonadaceae bacterium]